MATATLEEEQVREEELAVARAQYQAMAVRSRIAETIKELEQIQPPSKKRKIFLYWVAGGADLVDIIAFALEVFGLLTAGTLSFVVWLFSTIIDIGADVIIYFFARKASEQIKHYREAAEDAPELIRFASRQYLRGLKAGRNIKALRPIVNKVGLAIAKARKSPMGRQFLAFFLDAIPGIEIVPWRTFAVHGMLKAEKQTYENAQTLIQQLAA